MAEAGIKISQLKTVVPSNDGSDYTIIVKDGNTRRTYLSSLNDFFTTGSSTHTAGEINSLKEDVSVLKSKTDQISANAVRANDRIDGFNEITAVFTASINETVSQLKTNFNSLTATINSFQSTMDSISVLTDSQETLSSLTSVIDLLAGEDGQASLSNMADEIKKLDARVDKIEESIEEKIDPAIKIVERLASNETYNAYTNSLYVKSDSLNTTYYMDRNRPINLPKNALVSITQDSGASTSTIVSCQNGQLISATYATEEGAPGSTILTSTIEVIDWPGEETFSGIDAIPIRVGEMSIDDGSLNFNAYVSGNSDVDVYVVREAKISSSSNSDLKMDIVVNRTTVGKIKTGSKTGSDADLDLIFSGRVRGGSNIRFNIDNIDGSNFLSGNLIGAIACKQLPSEQHELNLNLLSVSSKAVDNDPTSTTIAYSFDGGVTGDAYALSVGYRGSNDSGNYTWITLNDNNSEMAFYPDPLKAPYLTTVNLNNPIAIGNTVLLSATNSTDGGSSVHSRSIDLTKYDG